MMSAVLNQDIGVSDPSSPARPPRVYVIGYESVADSFEWHILDSLRQLKCETEFFATQAASSALPKLVDQGLRKAGKLLLREPERLFERRLIRAVHAFQPSLILVIHGNQLSPKTIRGLRAVTKAPMVCWYQDQMTTLGRQFLLGSEYDAVFVKDLYMQDLFSRMIRSTSFFYLPEACNPRVHRSVELTVEDRQRYGCDVMIAGTLYYYRQEILRQLADFDLKVWGSRPDWMLNRLKSQHGGKTILTEEKARAMAAARICLNTLHYGEVNGLNCRAFEIAGCGGFQLITSVPVLASHFDVGTEVVEFGSTEQLVELMRHYLDHPDLAAKIARQGQIRAHRDHTYEHRLKELLRVSLGYAAIDA
jgi:spore maturation protein CgeB